MKQLPTEVVDAIKVIASHLKKSYPEELTHMRIHKDCSGSILDVNERSLVTFDTKVGVYLSD